jgi:Poly(R)-hydroxyalkanoic acid synthase subunit (PHA_synth_III_E)
MSNPFGQSGFQPDAAFTAAAGRFFELLKTLGVPAGARPVDWSALGAPLATQFEQWLRGTQAAGPWFAGGAPWGAGSLGGASPAATFGPLPLGPAAVQTHDAQRTFDLVAKLTQLQGQLAAHWSEIASSAARSFVARVGARGARAVTPAESLQLYELWVSCAEEAYAATVHKEDFAHLQAELANTSAALLVEQRRHAETLVRAFGLPTRSEVDALYDQLKELRRTLAGLTVPPRAPHPPATPARSAARKSSKPRRKAARRTRR